MKKLALVLALLLLIPVLVTTTNAVPSEISVEDLVKNPGAFDDRYVTLQGVMVMHQLFAKPTEFYLRDDMDNMIRLKFSDAADPSNYAGKKIEVTGVFEAEAERQLVVSELTPLEEGNPESLLVTGAQNTIVIMAYFTNRNNTKNQGEVYRMIFNDMNGYYMEVSYDLLYVTGGWDPWRKIGHTVAYYGTDSATTIDDPDNDGYSESWWFIRDAVKKADPYVNFALYSKFIFVCAGPNQESSGVTTDIWSCRWHGLSIATGDGVTITHGMIVPDIEAGGRGVLGVHAHEYGHELELPDLYGYEGGVGSWDLMATGCWNNLGKTPAQPTSYCRILQGWIGSSRIRNVPYETADLLMLDPLEDPTGTIQVIKLIGLEGDYYLIEARRKVGFDAYVPGEKVLVLYYNAGKLYLKATLSAGQSYRTSSVEVMVTKEDMENWSFQVYVAYRSWSSDMRLTNNAAPSEANWRGQAVASVGSYVYAVWADDRDGNWEIYYKRATNNGLTWGPDTRLTNEGNNSCYPSVAAYGSYVYVVWQDDRDGNWEIYLLRSENYGTSWYSAIRLTNNWGSSLRPSVAAYYRNVHVAWHDDRMENWEIYYKRSTNNGLNWGSDTRLTNDPSVSEYAYVAACGNYVYVAFQDDRFENYDVLVKTSTDNGATWTEQQLTFDTSDQKWASIAAYGYDVHVVWTDYRTEGNTEIYYRRSLDKGATYKPEIRLTSSAGESTYPSVAVKGKTVYVVWQDYRTERWEIWFKDSPDRGVHWTADRILSAQPSTSQWPSVSVSGDNVYVVWTDNRNRNYEIYFKYRW